MAEATKKVAGAVADDAKGLRGRADPEIYQHQPMN